MYETSEFYQPTYYDQSVNEHESCSRARRAISSAVFRPSGDGFSLLQTDWALWSKTLLKAMGLSSSAVVYNKSWGIYFPNNSGVPNSNFYILCG